MQAVRSRSAAISRVAQARAMSSFNVKSVMQNIFESSKMPNTPLNETFPETPAAPATVPSEEIKVTKCDNGINVISCDAGQSLASVGLFVDAGSRYESHGSSGISHFLEGMAFKSTQNRSEFRTVREMLKVGASVSAHSSRESIIYSADVLREYVPTVMGTFGDVVQNHAFKTYEVEDHASEYLKEAEFRAQDPEQAIVEGIHEAAYFNNTLGLPLYAPSSNVSSFTGDALQNYIETFFRPERMVIAGVGVPHQELVDLTNMVFDELKTSETAPVAEAAKYTGGEVRMHNKGADGNANVFMAFETADWNSNDLVPMCVLQMLMGGGGSFSAGGPGKGMCSRLYEQVLNQYPWVDSASCANFVYSDSALFGIHGSCHPQHVASLVEVFTAQLTGMTGQLSDVELARAKNQLKSNVMMQLEGRGTQMEDLGRQFLTYGKVETAESLCQKIDAVSTADINRVAATMLKTPLSLAAHGDLSYLPRYEEIARNFA